MEVTGRVDNQVKIRGFRIELGMKLFFMENLFEIFLPLGETFF